jgi:hypothetical protein
MNLSLGDTRLIIDTCKQHGLLRNQCAYVLATCYHESAHRMKPIRELGGEAYLRKKKYYPYVGMGYVQLTWLANYQKASAKLGVDFVANPKLLLEAKYAAPILVIGSKEGWFTGKKLSDYITLYKSDFRNARKIINGMDRADDIAGYAKQYDALLKAEGYGNALPIDPGKVVVLPPDNTPDLPVKNRLVALLLDIIHWLFGRK